MTTDMVKMRVSNDPNERSGQQRCRGGGDGAQISSGQHLMVRTIEQGSSPRLQAGVEGAAAAARSDAEAHSGVGGLNRRPVPAKCVLATTEPATRTGFPAEGHMSTLMSKTPLKVSLAVPQAETVGGAGRVLRDCNREGRLAPWDARAGPKIRQVQV